MKFTKRFFKNVCGLCLTPVIILVMCCLFFELKQNVIVIAKDTAVEYGATFQDDASATLLGYDVTQLFLRTDDVVDTSKLGTQRIIYYCLGSTYERIVTVIDTESPVIKIEGNEVCEVQNDISFFEDPGVTVTDNVDKDIQNRVDNVIVNIEENKYQVIYEVADSSGNIASARRDIIVIPEAKPEIQEQPEQQENNSKGTIYLTFDDGPSNLTLQVLEILKENNVNATFFVVGGFDPKNEEWKLDIMRKAVDEGNTVALHGNSHDYSKIYSSVTNATSNFTEENQFLIDNLGIDTKIIRFPGGSSNTVSKNYCEGVMSSATEILTNLGYKYFDWNVDSNDAGSDVGLSENIYNNVISTVVAGRDNVILMHDGSYHEASIEALPKIIQVLKDEGYEFKAIKSDTPTVQHRVNN